MSNKQIFKKFFKEYSNNVDRASLQYFWKLSDEIVLSIINQVAGKSLTKNSVILDAGGGTGRWIEVLSKTYPSKFILIDNSSAMLEVARNKEELKKLDKRLKILQGDIQNMSSLGNNSIDLILSIYNPISFVEKPLLFFKEVQRVLKPRSRALITGQGYFNAIASKINNYLADTKELKKMNRSKKVKWNESLAPLHVFSKESLEDLAKKSKLKTLKMYGIPVFAQPGPEDFDPENKLKSPISKKLKRDKKFYQEVMNLEIKYNSQDSMINRGMNLMTVVEKT